MDCDIMQCADGLEAGPIGKSAHGIETVKKEPSTAPKP
jgi:hypothetical protein